MQPLKPWEAVSARGKLAGRHPLMFPNLFVGERLQSFRSLAELPVNSTETSWGKRLGTWGTSSPEAAIGTTLPDELTEPVHGILIKQVPLSMVERFLCIGRIRVCSLQLSPLALGTYGNDRMRILRWPLLALDREEDLEPMRTTLNAFLAPQAFKKISPFGVVFHAMQDRQTRRGGG